MPVVTTLESLDRDQMVRILTEPKNALVKQYRKLLEYDEVELVFEEEALEAVADKAIERQHRRPGPAGRDGKPSDADHVRHPLGPYHRQSRYYQGVRRR